MIAAGVGVYCSSAVFSHDGHGMVGTHWHACDTWGFVLAVAVAAWLFSGRPGDQK